MNHARWCTVCLFHALLGLAALAEERAPLEIEIRHNGDACGAYEKNRVCGTRAHWQYAIDGKAVADEDALRALLGREARAGRDAGKKGREAMLATNSRVLFRVDWNAPYGLTNDAMHLCACAGIYKLEWCGVAFRGRAEGAADGKHVAVWLPTGAEKDEPAEVVDPSAPVMDEVRVSLTYDAGTGEVTRRILGTPYVDSGKAASPDGDAESDTNLMDLAKDKLATAEEAGRRIPFIIEADPETPFRAVAHLVDVCAAQEIKKLEFAQPRPKVSDEKER